MVALSVASCPTNAKPLRAVLWRGSGDRAGVWTAPARTCARHESESRYPLTTVYFLALAADYDGTIAEHGVVARETLEALQRFKRTGRRLILVTGRRLPSIQRAFPEYSLFDRIVAENGAVLFDP